MRAISVLHPVITVSDMDEALGFYRDLLGLEMVVEHVHDPRLLEPMLGREDGDVRAVILRCTDGTELELAEFRRPRGRRAVEKLFQDAGITFVTLVVDDLDGMVARLKAHGHETTGPISVHPFPSPVRVAYLYGPDGTGLTLAEFLSEVAAKSAGPDALGRL